MAWGELFTSPDFLKTITGVVGSADPLIQAGSALFGSSKANKAYDVAAKENKALLAEQQATVRAQAEMDALLRSRILTQTQELGTNLRTAYNTLGPQPVFDSGRLSADYGRLREQGMSDLNDLINLTNSQGYASGINQRGGAESTAIEGMRQTALVKQFAPQVAAVSNNAWGQAVDRATGEMNLLNQNRQNIMGEIQSTLTPELNANLSLFKPGQTSDMATQALGTLKESNVTTAKDKAEKNSALSIALQNLFSPTPSQPQISQTIWPDRAQSQWDTGAIR